MSTIIITGATSGIGLESAKHLASDGHRIIAASRKKTNTAKEINNINKWCQEKNPNGEVIFYDLDLSSLKSIEHFSERIIEDFDCIDILICNAGIMAPPYQLTEDGFESQFQVNFLGHFYLTTLLFRCLRKSQKPKVINLCSSSAEKGEIHDIEALEKISHVERSQYNGLTSYRESKLAQQVATMEMSRMPEFETIKFALIHPGIVNTGLFNNGKSNFLQKIISPIGYLSGKLQTPKQGAETTIYLAENDYPSGTYWHKEKQIPMNPISHDSEYGDLLYNWSLEQLKIHEVVQNIDTVIIG